MSAHLSARGLGRGPGEVVGQRTGGGDDVLADLDVDGADRRAVACSAPPAGLPDRGTATHSACFMLRSCPPGVRRGIIVAGLVREGPR
jgi:hypothetical protein